MIDYNKFLENRFDIVVRYHYLKKFDFNYEQITKWSKNQEWIKKISGKKVFGNWIGLSNIISEEWLKKHPFIIINNFYGNNAKRFIISLSKELHLYWTNNYIEISHRIFNTKRKEKFSILFIKKLFTEEEFKEIKDTMYEMIKKMKELKYFSEDYMIENKNKIKIDDILMKMDKNIHSGKKNIRFSKVNFYYHSVPELNIKGYRNCLERITTWNINLIIKNKKVLDIGSNMGMMSIECAKKAQLVHGIETSIGYIEISNILKNYFKLNNVEFINKSFIDYIESNNEKYDVILALAVHNWFGMSVFDFAITCKNILSDNGIIIFETHRSKQHREKYKEIEKAGYKVKEIGFSNDGRYTFECKIGEIK